MIFSNCKEVIMIEKKFTLLSNEEQAGVIGSRGGISCLLSGVALAISLVSMNVIAIVASVAAADQSC